MQTMEYMEQNSTSWLPSTLSVFRQPVHNNDIDGWHCTVSCSLLPVFVLLGATCVRTTAVMFRQFGISAEVSYGLGTIAVMYWVQTVLGPKCLYTLATITCYIVICLA